ncbi:MAG: hypothetical protein AAF600_17965 [Bacteroidota bacterium]
MRYCILMKAKPTYPNINAFFAIVTLSDVNIKLASTKMTKKKDNQSETNDSINSLNRYFENNKISGQKEAFKEINKLILFEWLKK